MKEVKKIAKDNRLKIGIVLVLLLIGGLWYTGYLDKYISGSGAEEGTENIGMMCYDVNKDPIDCITGEDKTFAVVELPVGTIAAQNVQYVRFVFRASNNGDSDLTDVKITELTCSESANCEGSFPTTPTTGIDLAQGDCHYWNWDAENTGFGSCTHSDTGAGALIDVQDGLPSGTYDIHLKVEGMAGELVAEGVSDIQFVNTQQGLTIQTSVDLG